MDTARGKRKAELTLDIGWAGSLDPRFLALQGRLVLLKMRAHTRNSTKDLPLVEGDTPGKWICKGKANPSVIMTVLIKESDNKLRFLFSQNPFQLESQVANIKQSRSGSFDELDPLQKKTSPESAVSPGSAAQKKTFVSCRL